MANFDHQVRFGSVNFPQVRFGSRRARRYDLEFEPNFGSVRFGSVRYNLARVRFGSNSSMILGFIRGCRKCIKRSHWRGPGHPPGARPPYVLTIASAHGFCVVIFGFIFSFFVLGSSFFPWLSCAANRIHGEYIHF